MPVGDVVGAVPLAMPITFAAEVPKDATPRPRLPLASILALSVNVVPFAVLTLPMITAGSPAAAYILGHVVALSIPMPERYVPAE